MASTSRTRDLDYSHVLDNRFTSAHQPLPSSDHPDHKTLRSSGVTIFTPSAQLIPSHYLTPRPPPSHLTFADVQGELSLRTVWTTDKVNVHEPSEVIFLHKSTTQWKWFKPPFISGMDHCVTLRDTSLMSLFRRNHAHLYYRVISPH